MAKRNCYQCEDFYKLLLSRMNKRNELVKRYTSQLFDYVESLVKTIKEDKPPYSMILVTQQDYEKFITLVSKCRDFCHLPVDAVLSDMDMVNPLKEFKPCEGQLDFLRELDAASR